MTVNKEALPGHETQSSEMNCPSCGRFVGAVTKCPYCGAKVEKRMSLVAIRWAAVLLATVGLFLLFLMAKHRDIPVVKLADVKPTMNFAQIRVEGVADSDARTFRSGGGMGFNFSDGTGTIMVFISQKQAQEMVARNLVPKAGDQVSFAGGLNISDDRSSMRLLSVDEFQVVRAPAAALRLADVTTDLKGSSITVEGKVMDLFPPPANSKRPYALKLKDDSGEQTLNFWQAEYDQIANKDVLVGAYVRARVSVAAYQDKLQLKLASGQDLEILDGPPAAAAYASPAQKAAATYRQQAAPAPAPRDFSRGRSVASTSLSVSAVTAAMKGQTVRVRGRVESVKAPQEGTKQPFAVILSDGGAKLRATYWSNADAVIAVKPTPGALFEMEGVVDVYQDRPQLQVESGYKVKLVDDTPASTPAVDVSKAVRVSSITAAALGQTRTVQGTLGAPRALRGGVTYALTDDTGTIDLVLWESIIPVEVLDALEEGAKVAATGEVKEYEGKLQLTAASGHSAMVIP
jgi:DNA/RNA endonuclease YhcR with UshA esterase domain